jgi:hypothetical protein
MGSATASGSSVVMKMEKGRALRWMIEERILQVPPAILAYDLARWGTVDLSLVAREERREALWPGVKNFHHFTRTQTI